MQRERRREHGRERRDIVAFDLRHRAGFRHGVRDECGHDGKRDEHGHRVGG
ncbi:MAG: hypothetical protein ACRDVE_16135 [Actinocrinis sp.]